MLNNSSLPLRRDIRALGPYQRQRFFYCLKFLSVLPPQQKHVIRTYAISWKVQNEQRYYKINNPKNIHDELTASHQTSCEHASINFAYYHRHMLLCLEIYMNYAQQVLINGKDHINKQLYLQYQNEFDVVFNKYKQIVKGYREQLNLGQNAKLPQVKIHYWNPIDYTKAFVYPPQLKEGNITQMDTLYYAINKHYPWTFNFPNRWFNDQPRETPGIPKGFETMGFFQNTPEQYDKAQKAMVYGNLNPRVKDAELSIIQIMDLHVLQKVYQRTANINLYQNYEKLRKTNGTIEVCTIDKDQLNTLYGSQIKNLHWINAKERVQMKTFQSTKAYSYNKSLPHFQFAYALYHQPSKFINNYITIQGQSQQNSMEHPHNTMHDFLPIFMANAELSVISPLFFLYHSFIDYQLQLKIRMITNSNTSYQQYINTLNFLKNRFKPNSVLDQVSLPPNARKNQPIRFGDYHIFQWYNPMIKFNNNIAMNQKEYIAAFKVQNFIINDKSLTIRRSNDLNQFYHSQYLPKHGDRYNFFKGFKQFNFSYNYQIIDYDELGQQRLVKMEDKVVAIPSYISKIYEDYKYQWNRNKTRTTISQPNDQIKKLNTGKQSDKIIQNNLQNQSHLSGQGSSLEQTENIRQMIRSIRLNIGGYGRYPSQTPSVVAPILMRLTPKGKKLLKFKPDHYRMLKEGIHISAVSLFTKREGSNICVHCHELQQIYIQISEPLSQMNEDLFSQISLKLASKQILKYKNNQLVEIQETPYANQCFELYCPKPIFKQLVIGEGAYQVVFDVSFLGQQQFQTSQVKIQMYNYALQTNELHSVASARRYSLRQGARHSRPLTIQFPIIYNLANHQNKNYKYLYKQAKIYIRNGKSYSQVSFDIKNMHQSIYYRIQIVERANSTDIPYLDVHITDKHYSYKVKHYSFKM